MSEPEKSEMAFEANGPNPHYRPLIMQWNQVEIIAEEGTSFGIECDSGGLLSIAVRGPEKLWPHGRDEPKSGLNTIEPGNQSYLVTSDERGPAIGHEFKPDPLRPEKCLLCLD